MTESRLRTLLWLCWGRLRTIAPDDPLTVRAGEALNEGQPAKHAPASFEPAAPVVLSPEDARRLAAEGVELRRRVEERQARCVANPESRPETVAAELRGE